MQTQSGVSSTRGTRDGVLIVRCEAPIFLGNADYFRQSVLGLVDEQVPSPHALVLVCDAVSDIDLTGLDALRDLVEDVQHVPQAGRAAAGPGS